MLPATSPSGPPVIFTVNGCLRGSMPRARSATSRKTFTPSLVTPYTLWLMPAPGFELMKASGRAYLRARARETIHSMCAGVMFSSGPR